jgi:dTDP-4-amino-4,6-dideoxygalactose transaminase
MYTPHHVWNLGKSINNIWGEEMTETLLELSATSLKMNNNDRREIYDVYKTALEKFETQSLSTEQKRDLIGDCYYYYLRVVSKLIKK